MGGWGAAAEASAAAASSALHTGASGGVRHNAVACKELGVPRRATAEPGGGGHVSFDNGIPYGI